MENWFVLVFEDGVWEATEGFDSLVMAEAEHDVLLSMGYRCEELKIVHEV